jgi:Flp pilus assembly protein TadG
MAWRARPAFWLTARRLRGDDRGTILLMVALITTALLAVTGVAVDVGWWYTIQRQNQSAADSGALSAAYEMLNHPTWTTQALLGPAALSAAKANGYTGSTATVTYPCTNASPPCLAANSTGVQVNLQQAQTTWFASLASLTGVTIANRAVAKATPLDNPCMYVTSTTADQALFVKGSATLNSPTCAICVDSNKFDAIATQGGASANLIADSLITPGQISSTGSATPQLNHPAQVGASNPLCADPYAATLTHSFLTTGMPTTACPTATGNGTATVTVSSGCSISGVGSGNNQAINPSNGGTVSMGGNNQITGGWNIKNETVNLAPGTYWITDGDLVLDSNSVLECTTCVAGGAGVTIILTTAGGAGAKVGNVTQASNAVISSLNAPGSTSATFQNLLLIQDSNGTGPPFTFTTPGNCSSSCSTFQGGPSATLTGLVYFPDTNLTFNGNPTTGNASCLLTVALTLTLSGNTSLSTAACPTVGPGGVHQVFTVALVE